MANLIFLHGFPFNGSSWNAQVEHFNAHTAFAPDLRGHGNAKEEPGPWFMHHYAEDLKKFLDEKKIDKAILCGLSMGGYVALHFAQKYPASVAGLILCDTQAGPDSNEAKDKRFATLQKIQQEGLEKFAQEFSRNVLSESNLARLQKPVAEMILKNKSTNVAQVLGTLASRKDSTPHLAEIKCPTLVLVGEEDKVTPPALNQKMAEAITGAEFYTIKGAAHLSNLEQPEEFNSRVEAFLQKNF